MAAACVNAGRAARPSHRSTAVLPVGLTVHHQFLTERATTATLIDDVRVHVTVVENMLADRSGFVKCADLWSPAGRHSLAKLLTLTLHGVECCIVVQVEPLLHGGR